jgi:fermentation-respiration switch protein FrsA (DUF1100 family)
MPSAGGLVEELIWVHGPRGRLATTLHIPPSTPAPALVMCHGFTGNKVEAHRLFVRAAREFCRRGILTARFDFYGSGESEGEFHEMTLSSEIEDLGAILDYLLRRPEVDPRKVGALGLSMGGVVALARAAADGRIRFVVTWSAPASFQMLVETAENLFREAEVRGEYVDLPSGYRISREFIQDIARHTVLEYAPRISPRPLLILHGDRDTVVPPSHAEELYKSAKDPREMAIIKGGDHTFTGWDVEWDAITVTADWLRRVTDALREG